jgi:hypothetical protein
MKAATVTRWPTSFAVQAQTSSRGTAAAPLPSAAISMSAPAAALFDHNIAGALAGMGVPAFACTPDKFPDLMAAEIQQRDISDGAKRGDHYPTKK